ncbi:MAG TPA: bifunctional precorrin-2 dehydrogenase/sirohydrochlorin ferrochelatase [Nitrosopumilaceae archaeon]|jgi:precorrin-2 dehydrogenase/sirohydrochlorin ferrochelatase|nr:bifunctional precorrin-2 dehydrogenase/sirohydrochlorin ferrochelatase [Nitrosopumilaceae archaeon]
MNTLFPIFLKLEELHTLIVGGGKIGLEKISVVLANSPKAKITLVAPQIRKEIVELTAGNPNINIAHRIFIEQDLEDKNLVIIATNNKKESERVRNIAKQHDLLCNVADTPELCDFYLASIVQKNDLKIAISTNGLSPTAAKRIRETLQECFPDQIETTLQNLQKIREYLTGDFSDKVIQLNKITETLIKGYK